MINMIKDETHCEVIVGQNGVVWVKGEPAMERVAEKVINMIEESGPYIRINRQGKRYACKTFRP